MREVCQRRMRDLRRKNSDLSKKFTKSSALQAEDQAKYYSKWDWSAVHVLISIPEYQTVDAIASKLQLRRSRVEQVLSGLQEMGLAARAGTQWRSLKYDLFLGRESPLTFANHWNWRQKALADVQEGNQDSVHYTVLHTLSREDAVRFKSVLMDFLTETRELVGPSKEEEMICFSCDLFSL